MNLKSLFQSVNRWLSDTPERALDQAYKAALMIKAIEDEHFNGKKISAKSTAHSNSVLSYFEADLNKYLQIVKVRLAEFKSSRSVVRLTEKQKLSNNNGSAISNPNKYYSLETNDQQSVIIEKLDFIDQIISKYSEKEKPLKSASLVPVTQPKSYQVVKSELSQSLIQNAVTSTNSLQTNTVNKKGQVTGVDSLPNKPGIVPRSIFRTFNRIQQELDPNAEEEVINNFRSSKVKTIISLKFILTLIIVPLLTQQVTKTFVVGPVVDYFKTNKVPESAIFLNINLKEEAFEELKMFEEEMRFKNLLGFAPKLSQEEMENQVKEKAEEMAEEYRDKGANAIKNVIADCFSLLAFGLVLFFSKQDIVILKSFMDDLIYGLSDSAKAFVIILFSDMFVGFHSPHGWEVILEGISRHLGLPESREFIFLFIATFPVILDSVIKYWIFRYLNRVSPSAVATLRGMNE